jgi:hypothetical protein
LLRRYALHSDVAHEPPPLQADLKENGMNTTRAIVLALTLGAMALLPSKAKALGVVLIVTPFSAGSIAAA